MKYLLIFDKGLPANEIPANSWFVIDISIIIHLKRNQYIVFDTLNDSLNLYVALLKAQAGIHMQCAAFRSRTQKLSSLHCMTLHMDRLRKWYMRVLVNWSHLSQDNDQ
jgi:hypothetical protein